MPRIPLVGGAYEARSLAADCQRCVNLYPEKNPEGSESTGGTPYTYYPTPGLRTVATANPKAGWRVLFTSSNKVLYGVCGSKVFRINADETLVLLGSVSSAANPVSMIDNGTTMVVVDNGPNGWTIQLNDDTFAILADNTGSFTGATKADYLDGFLVFNRRNTGIFYTSLSNVVEFDPLYFAKKSGYPDNIASLQVMHEELWLIGTQKSEIWSNVGAPDFPFQRFPGSFIEHGCVAEYSVAAQDLSVFWLGNDLQGQGMVLRGTDYKVKRVSTHALEKAIASYDRIDDAIGFCYQQEGHTFYVLTFPQANKTWVFDDATGFWHERESRNENGTFGRWRPSCVANAYGKVYAGDHSNGKLYVVDLNTYTEDGEPMRRIRSFPHLVPDGKRASYELFQADMELGNGDGEVALRWSNDRGKTFSSPLAQPIKAGNYLQMLVWRRLGMARDRVFELSWQSAVRTSLNGAWMEGPDFSPVSDS